MEQSPGPCCNSRTSSLLITDNEMPNLTGTDLLIQMRSALTCRCRPSWSPPPRRPRNCGKVSGCNPSSSRPSLITLRNSLRSGANGLARQSIYQRTDRPAPGPAKPFSYPIARRDDCLAASGMMMHPALRLMELSLVCAGARMPPKGRVTPDSSFWRRGLGSAYEPNHTHHRR